MDQYLDIMELTSPYDWDNMNPLKIEEKRGRPMTIIIGALCDGGETVLLLADRMTTIFPSGLVFKIKKEIKLNAQSLVLTSGTVHHLAFVNHIKKNIKESFDIEQIVEILCSNYASYRIRRIEKKILNSQKFASVDDFYQKQKQLDSYVNLKIMEDIKNYNLGIDLILGGVKEGGHLFHITNPGIELNCNLLGLSCAGVGANRALPIFDLFKYSKDLPLEKVMSIAFIAKKNTEAMGGIGIETDMWLITNEGIHKINDETTLLLEDMYNKTKDRFFNMLKKITIKKHDIAMSPIPS